MHHKKKKMHPNDRPRRERKVDGTSSLAGTFIFYLVDYFLNDISNNLSFDKPASKGEVYMLPLICCVLMAADFEAIRNELFFVAKKQRSRNIGKDIVSLLSGTIPSSLEETLSQAINEAFVLRDSIIHGHLYQVKATYYLGTKEDPFTMDTRNYRHKKIQSSLFSQGDKKFLEYVNLRHKQTKYLKLNVLPLNVNFADLLTLLILYDVLDGIYLKKNGFRIFTLPLTVHGMLVGQPPQAIDDVHGSLGQILAHYYRQKVKIIKHKGKVLKPRSRANSRFKNKIDYAIKKLKKDFGKYSPAPTNDVGGLATCVINNICPKCDAFGFQTPFYPFGKCWKCPYEDTREKTYDNPYFSL